MSRRLFTTRMAVASAPTGTAAIQAAGGTAWSCTYVVPAVATRPKKTNTNRSPRPWYPNGHGPPVYAHPAAIEASPVIRMGQPPTTAR